MLFDFSKVGTGERINENTVTRVLLKNTTMNMMSCLNSMVKS